MGNLEKENYTKGQIYMSEYENKNKGKGTLLLFGTVKLFEQFSSFSSVVQLLYIFVLWLDFVVFIWRVVFVSSE